MPVCHRFYLPKIKTGVLRRYAGLCIVFGLLFGNAVSGNALADNSRGVERQHEQGRQQQGIGAAQAAEQARRQYGGEVLKVKRDGNGYRVKLLLPSGTVKTVYISAGG